MKKVQLSKFLTQKQITKRGQKSKKIIDWSQFPKILVSWLQPRQEKFDVVLENNDLFKTKNEAFRIVSEFINSKWK